MCYEFNKLTDNKLMINKLKIKKEVMINKVCINKTMNVKIQFRNLNVFKILQYWHILN